MNRRWKGHQKPTVLWPSAKVLLGQCPQSLSAPIWSYSNKVWCRTVLFTLSWDQQLQWSFGSWNWADRKDTLWVMNASRSSLPIAVLSFWHRLRIRAHLEWPAGMTSGVVGHVTSFHSAWLLFVAPPLSAFFGLHYQCWSGLWRASRTLRHWWSCASNQWLQWSEQGQHQLRLRL